jgi:hypothetical protein
MHFFAEPPFANNHREQSMMLQFCASPFHPRWKRNPRGIVVQGLRRKIDNPFLAIGKVDAKLAAIKALN